MLNERYPESAQPLDLGVALVYASNYYPSQFNAFEEALESFTRIGVNVNIGSKKTFKGNDPFIDYNELNRLEKCCVKWYEYDPVIHVSSISISPSSASIKVGETKTFTVTCLPANAEDINDWVVTSSNTSVMTVVKNGTTIIATGVGIGTATINVSVYKVFASATLKVEPILVTQIIPESNTVDIPYQANVTFGYTLLPANATNKNELTVTSSKPSAVTVGYGGEGTIIFYGKAVGQSNITFKCGQISAVVNANVLNTASKIHIQDEFGRIINATKVPIGYTFTYYIVTEPVNAIDKDEFSYTVENPQYIDVVRSGNTISFTTKSAGTCRLIVTLDSGRDTTWLNIEVYGN
jgi:hypothetical protein